MDVRLFLRALRPCLRRCYATAPTAPSAPPLLLKLRADLKTAMKAKDTNRLNVLRALLSETTNASKTSSPIKTNIQLLSLLRKRAATSRAAASEFSAANRDDLKAKEDAQVTILEEYAGGVETTGSDEIRQSIDAAVEALKVEGGRLDIGTLLKRVIGPGGILDGRPVERAEVARIAKEVFEVRKS
ncbi:MAG: hypothetical protein M1836_006498 [Candelina mexicana]|nr:MAG: hypothetical protein M1836_006498 [Candelina mexicana]